MSDVIADDREVRVTFRKQVSDGNYGTEAAEITLTGFADGDEDQDATAEGLFMAARRLVNAELARSPSANVRRALVPVPARRPAGPPPEPDDEGEINMLSGSAEPWR